MVENTTYFPEKKGFLPRQPEPTPPQPTAVKLLGPPCRFADTTLLTAAFHRTVHVCVG